MGCISGTPEAQNGTGSNSREIDDEKKVDSSSSKTKKTKLPANVRSVGIDPDFKFVDADHNLRPSVMPLFIKEKVLGQGGSCEVAQMRRKHDGAEFAVKIMKRDDKWNPILFRQEYELLNTLKHPNILGYEDCYMDKNNFYICTSLCKGGELFDKIKELKKFNEVDAAEHLKVIISAIAHCHERNIVHRDLKPENIVFRTKERKELVVIDFGDAKIINDDVDYEDFVGTAFYLAPECVRKRKGWELKKSDMWTIGVIAYLLLTGRPPFYGRSNKDILRKIIRAKFTWPSSSRLSKSAKNFIRSLIAKETKNRLSAKECLEHMWLKGSAGTEDLGVDLLKSISNYSKAKKLKKELVRMLANEMTEADHLAMKQDFDKLDSDGNGQIDLEELTNFILTQGVTRLEAQSRAAHIIKEVDQNDDGQLNIEEWKNAKVSGLLGNDDKLLKTHFNRIDEDNDGFITHEELSKLFNWTLTKDLISQMIQEIDENKDGKISYAEFVRAMKDGSIEKAISSRAHITKELTHQVRDELLQET
jgi:calcium-dependent protein kinase